MTPTDVSPRIFFYKVEYYDKDLEDLEETTGIVVGLNYASAAYNVEISYGNENITNLEIRELDILMDEDALRAAFIEKKELYF